MAMALTALALVFATGAGEHGRLGGRDRRLMLYVAAFAISLGPIFWLLNAELYPLAVRSKAARSGRWRTGPSTSSSRSPSCC